MKYGVSGTNVLRIDSRRAKTQLCSVGTSPQPACLR